MNQTFINWNNKLTAPADAKQACRVLGLLALMGSEFDVLVTAYLPGEATPDSVLYRVTHPLRLPFADNIAINVTGFLSSLVSRDSMMTQQIQNVERAIVNQGDFIAAIASSGVDLSSQLVSAFQIVGAGQQVLWIGTASQSAQQGVYETPFSDAVAFVNFGALPTSAGGLGATTPVVVVPSAPPVQTVDRNSVPMAPERRN